MKKNRRAIVAADNSSDWGIIGYATTERGARALATAHRKLHSVSGGYHWESRRDGEMPGYWSSFRLEQRYLLPALYLWETWGGER